HPTINTRGSIIAYANNGIYTVRTDGTTTPIQIDSAFASDYPEFSPDGFFVLYKKNNDIYARRADCSSEPTRLTYTSSVYGDIRFSPQAQEIVFTGISNSQKHIFRCPVHISLTGSISITAGSPVDLTPLTSDNYQPAWSCDGSTIVFISTRNKIAELWLMNRDGTGQRKILFSSSAPENPSNPCFATDSSSTIFYLSGSSKQFYTADISQPSISGALVFSSFPSPSAESFFIGRRSENVIECERFVNIKERDPAVPFTYFLTMHVDKIPDSSKSAIITEIIPSGWELKDITINGAHPGQLTSNSATTGTLKWLFGPSGIADLQDSILQITLDIPDTEPYGSIKGFSGWCETNGIKTYTTGCSNIFIAEPFIPVDTDKNWQISDEELLYTISLWSQNGKISGWPDDVLTWDWWLLSVIGFWANADGYAYDSDASKVSGIYIWKKI
ncbi:MAG TPA: hypothetical protein PKX05_04735, partial [bacterium]|nr:hypothetical protein [bacterium]